MTVCVALENRLGLRYHFSLMPETSVWPSGKHSRLGSSPAISKIFSEPKQSFTAQSFSFSPSHHLDMTETLLKTMLAAVSPVSLMAVIPDS